MDERKFEKAMRALDDAQDVVMYAGDEPGGYQDVVKLINAARNALIERHPEMFKEPAFVAPYAPEQPGFFVQARRRR